MCVCSFACASSSLRSASHSSRETTRGLSLAAREVPVVLVVCVLIALAPSFGYTIAARHGRWCLSLEIPSARHRQGGSDKCDGIPMDSLITAAARALAAGDLLGVLKRVGLRDDAPALALRGIAMAQLGDFARADRKSTRLNSSH